MPRHLGKYIKTMLNKDKIAFTTIMKTGHISVEQLNNYCGVVKSRANKYVQDGYVVKVPLKQGNIIIDTYKLTKEGKDFARKQLGITRSYHAQSSAHDIKLANKYFSLTPGERETWKTESQSRELLEQKIEYLRDQGNETTANLYKDMLERNLISIPDAVYTTEQGTEIAFEVLTNNYGQAEMIAKETFVEIMKVEYQTTRV